MIFGNNLGKRTETAKQALLAYIWDQRLEVGDRLPTQVELCRRFNVGSATVDRAVRALVKEQVLESRRGIGVFVKTSRPTGYPGRFAISRAGIQRPARRAAGHHHALFAAAGRLGRPGRSRRPHLLCRTADRGAARGHHRYAGIYPAGSERIAGAGFVPAGGADRPDAGITAP